MKGREVIPSRFTARVSRGTIAMLVVCSAIAFPLGTLATHQFSDVPTGASYHDDVEALVAAGVTSGCGGGEYCPADPVTRGQMAQFLNRIGSLDGSTPPSVDADLVDGFHADELNVAAQGDVGGDLPLTGDYQTVGTVTIATPGPGFVLVHGSTTVYSFDGDCPCEITAGLSDDGVGITSPVWNNARVGIEAGSTDVATIAVSYVFEVASAGTHTFYLTAVNHQAGAGVQASATFGSMVAQYSPFGVTATLGAPAAGSAGTNSRLGD
jgi:hypothetical protein